MSFIGFLLVAGTWLLVLLAGAVVLVLLFLLVFAAVGYGLLPVLRRLARHRADSAVTPDGRADGRASEMDGLSALLRPGPHPEDRRIGRGRDR